MNFRKNLVAACVFSTLFTSEAAFSFLRCCSDDADVVEPLARSSQPQYGSTTSPQRGTPTDTFSPPQTPVTAPATIGSIKSPPSPLRSGTVVSLESAGKRGLPLKQLVASSHTEIRAEEEGEDIFLNVMLEDARYIYVASRAKNAVDSDAGSVDQYLLQTPTAGTTVSSLPTELEQLRVTLNSLHDAQPINSLIVSASAFLQASGQRVRRLADADGSVYLFTQDAATAGQTQRIYALGLIHVTNGNLGLAPLPASKRLTLQTAASLSKLDLLELSTAQ